MTAAMALGRMREILNAPVPYGMIKHAESPIQTVEGVNAALVAKRRDHVLHHIDGYISKVKGDWMPPMRRPICATNASIRCRP